MGEQAILRLCEQAVWGIAALAVGCAIWAATRAVWRALSETVFPLWRQTIEVVQRHATIRLETMIRHALDSAKSPERGTWGRSRVKRRRHD